MVPRFTTVARAASGGSENAVVAELLLIGALVLVFGAILVWIAIVLRRRHLVDGASTALQQLAALNATYLPRTLAQPPIRLSFVVSVDSKSKFDRFDLNSFMRRCVMERNGA